MMETLNPHWVGAGAATLTTLAFLPQAIKVIRENDTRSISALMYSAFTVGVALWFVYGLLLKSPPMIIANVITLVLAAVILVQKIRHIRRKP